MAVNGTRIQAPGTRVLPDTDRVTVDGHPVAPPPEFVYVLLNKPSGVIVSLGDPHHPRTVVDLLDGLNRRVFPVGRLDLDTSGVLLLTDDGELTNRLCHPRYGVEKIYLARVEGVPDLADIRALSDGVEIEGRLTSPAKVLVRRRQRESSLLEIALHEGRKRQIKRMCKTVGHPVQTLVRISFGSLTAAGLEPGQWRYLTSEEVTGLRRMIGLKKP